MLCPIQPPSKVVKQKEEREKTLQDIETDKYLQQEI